MYIVCRCLRMFDRIDIRIGGILAGSNLLFSVIAALWGGGIVGWIILLEGGYYIYLGC